jgi:hypothetical protein
MSGACREFEAGCAKLAWFSGAASRNLVFKSKRSLPAGMESYIGQNVAYQLQEVFIAHKSIVCRTLRITPAE